jgi:dihydrofolate reductase
MKIISIAAVSSNGIIGTDGKLPWHLPEDLKYFRDSTRGQIVVMGRKTFESLGKPLPKRENAVLTRDSTYRPQGVRVFSEIKTALEFYQNQPVKDPPVNCFIVGGGQIYRDAMQFVDEVWLTEIDLSVQGDVKFPNYDEGRFQLACGDQAAFKQHSVQPKQDISTPISYRFVVYRRK